MRGLLYLLAIAGIAAAQDNQTFHALKEPPSPSTSEEALFEAKSGYGYPTCQAVTTTRTITKDKPYTLTVSKPVTITKPGTTITSTFTKPGSTITKPGTTVTKTEPKETIKETVTTTCTETTTIHDTTTSTSTTTCTVVSYLIFSYPWHKPDSTPTRLSASTTAKLILTARGASSVDVHAMYTKDT